MMTRPPDMQNEGELALVSGTEKVVDGLNRIESCDGDLDEGGVPIAHGTVPKTGELHGSEFFSVT